MKTHVTGYGFDINGVFGQVDDDIFCFKFTIMKYLGFSSDVALRNEIIIMFS